MAVFNGSISVPALKSCAIDTDLGTTVGVVTRNGVAGAGLGRAGVCSNDASGAPKYAIGILFWLKKNILRPLICSNTMDLCLMREDNMIQQ